MAQGYINDRTTDYLSLKSRLLTGASGQLSDQFDALNLHLRQASLVTPGQMVIVPDAYAVACTTDDAWLMRHAQEIQRNLELDASAGAAVINNYDLFQSLLAYSSVGVGSSTAAWGRHLDEVQRTLKEIERLHQQLKDGALNKKAFIQKRQMLFRRLDTQLQGAARFGTSLKTNKSLKKVLGISTKSYLHKSEIVGYTQRIRSIAETSRFLGKGTYVGLALDVGVAGLEIKEACMEGREAMCRRAKYVEGGKLVGGVGGAAGGGVLGAKVGRGLCKLVLGIATKGKGELACGIIGGAAGGYTGGTVGGALGEMAGDLFYEGEGA
ncbi:MULTISPECIES: hypothetical protein [unclassified Pseudomonas]|uniref:hypothetical protein n=1 Tax=unclassified Pseudomonas TaxID=196821 RepID=UPI0015A09274|nr:MULTISPECIES: hypothetical protein [unclassified Pseudomonas]NWB63313.1 hypothetical protein [Pseudomonas sp. F1002]NWC05081.1 hypothetical protein [Pseudomonas sp. G1002]